jgi:hypothetical protein
VGLTLAAATGLLSLAMDVVRLREDVKGLHDDVNEIKSIDLPRLQKNVDEIHDIVLHSSSVNKKSDRRVKFLSLKNQEFASINKSKFLFRRVIYQSKCRSGPSGFVKYFCAHRLPPLQIFPSGKSVSLFNQISNREAGI